MYEALLSPVSAVETELPATAMSSSGKRVFGLLEIASPDVIEGWAYDPQLPDTPVDIRITIDDLTVWTGPADLFRDDLIVSRIGDGRHAFQYRIRHESEGFGEGEHMVRASINSDGVELPGSPKSFRKVVEDDAPASSDRADEPTHVDLILGRTPEFIGFLDAIDLSQIRGWAYDQNAPSIPVSVDIFDGDRLLVRVTADSFRADLERNGIGNGSHAFAIPTPTSLLDGAVHFVKAVITNTTKELDQSPARVKLTASVPQQALAQVRATIHTSLQAIEQLNRIISPISQAMVRQTSEQFEAYQEWYAKYGIITSSSQAQMQACIQQFEMMPKFSVIMATFNTPPEILAAAIGSVTSQIYPNWELCIADDASTGETQDAIKQIAKVDARIKVVFRTVNGHISAATNSAMELATGDYMCFMDHDDVLTEDALFQFAFAVEHEGPALIYSDEDKIDEKNALYDPYFKPDFNYSLLLSHNYMCHFFAVKNSIADKVGVFRSKYDGSQDHDFILRCCETVPAEDIKHIPMVLYHWRSHINSTARSLDSKHYSMEAGIRAISDHLKRRRQKAIVEAGAGGSYRVRWLIGKRNPTVSIVIPTKDQSQLLSKCLTSITSLTNYNKYEILVVDNGSVEPATIALFKQMTEDPRIKVIAYDKTFNFSAICNFGAEHTGGELLLMMNNDIEVLDGQWLNEMVGQACRPQVGAVGAKLLYPDGRIQHAGVILGIGGVAGHSHKYFERDATGFMNRPNLVQELSGCTAACLLVWRHAFTRVNGFDEINLPVSFNDVDFCLRLREAGYQIVFTPHATLVHHESLSRGADDTRAKAVRANEEIRYMNERWAGLLTADPFYSPNLTLAHENFSIDPDRGVSRI